MILHAAWRADNDVHASAQAAFLRAVGSAAIEAKARQIACLREVREVCKDLLGQLTSWCKDNDRGATVVATGDAALLAGESFYGGKDKSEGLAAAGASSAYEIITLHNWVKAASLDGEEGFDAFGAYEGLDGRAEIEIVEG